jgi:segregation and condensation protein A
VVLTVKLPEFEGPLDLLLHLIQAAKMNIYDIPIVAITSQYLAYLQQMQTNQLEVAGDYFVMAATLMRIKSQMLLPKAPVQAPEQDDMTEQDPRAELVGQLISYQLYKQAAKQLQTRELARKDSFSKAPNFAPQMERIPMPEPPVQLTTLTQALTQLLQQAEPPQKTAVVGEKVTITKMIQQIKDQLQQNKPQEFSHLLPRHATTEVTVTTFLAVLELMRAGDVVCQQADDLAPLLLKRQAQPVKEA